MLSPEICVERKSLSDLRQSFISGRLYYQASAMTRHYPTPVLLIEFQRDAAFVLHAPADISDEIQVRMVPTRMPITGRSAWKSSSSSAQQRCLRLACLPSLTG